MDIKELKLNKKLLYALSILITLPLIILLLISFTPSHRNISKLNSICKDIEDCNLSLSKAINEESINSEESESLLSSGLLTLNSIKEKLSSLKVTSKNEAIKNKLLETLEYNIHIYDVTLSIIIDPKDKDIGKKYTDFTNTYELLLKNYDNLNLSGLKAKFPKATEIFFDNSSTFISTLIKVTRENDIKIDQKKSYVLNLEECLNEFYKIDEDLQPALEKIREDGRSLDVLLKDIKEKKSKFNEIKSKSYSLSIPENGNTCYELLQDTLNYYDLYITSLEHSIIVESTSKVGKDENINKNYTNSFSKFSDFTKNLKDLKTELDNFNKN